MTSSGSPYVPLTRRPQATTVSVKELIAKVEAGDVRMPSFQRPLRWKASDVRDLLDSVWRGYPVGSLLFWKRKAEASTIVVGNAKVTAPAKDDAWWVVDGQQRIIALAATLLELDHGSDGRWSISFDPEAQTFLARSDARLSPHTVPVHVLGDLRRLARWIREHELEDDHVDRLEDAQQRLLDYTIPAYVIETDEVDSLRAAFSRLNSTGVRMRADEVFQALVGAPSATRAHLDLDALQQTCDQNDFGMPPRADVLKAVLAMSGQQPTLRPENLSAGDLGALVSHDAAAAGLERTIEFIQRDCHIPHVRLLPYPIVLPLLARWFHVHRDAQPATLRRLSRWVWRSMVSAASDGSAARRMGQWATTIGGNDPETTLDALEDLVGELPERWTLVRFDQRTARSRIETLALLQLGPRDRQGLIQLQAIVSGDRIAREILASRDWGDIDPSLTKSAANRVILDSARSGLRSELRTWDPGKDRVALASHLIDPGAFDALLTDRFEAFLRGRADAVEAHVSEFVEQRIERDGPIVRPPSYYTDDLVDRVQSDGASAP